ncbi:MAG: hypothetical protein NXI09_15830 [Bacteroidetes bacterium]|nr:hypothetical protein [Bacteroidota bacterium]
MKKSIFIIVAILFRFSTYSQVSNNDGLYARMVQNHLEEYYGEGKLLHYDTVYLDNNLEVFRNDFKYNNVMVILINGKKELREKLAVSEGKTPPLLRVQALELNSSEGLNSAVMLYACRFSDVLPGTVSLGLICSSQFRLQYSCTTGDFLLLNE